MFGDEKSLAPDGAGCDMLREAALLDLSGALRQGREIVTPESKNVIERLCYRLASHRRWYMIWGYDLYVSVQSSKPSPNLQHCYMMLYHRIRL